MCSVDFNMLNLMRCCRFCKKAGGRKRGRGKGEVNCIQDESLTLPLSMNQLVALTISYGGEWLRA